LPQAPAMRLPPKTHTIHKKPGFGVTGPFPPAREMPKPLFPLLALLSLAIPHSLPGAGAHTPFTTVEAETGSLHGGAFVSAFVHGSPVPAVATLELEASGGAFVRLNRTGAAVSWRNPVAGANGIVVRNSIPDTPEGGGRIATLNLYVDGEFRQALRLSSEQSWSYRTPRGWLDKPDSGGMPFHFYNEDLAFITGAPVALGSVLTLRKDPDNNAPDYSLDCIDLEAVPQPSTRPPGSLSVLDFGASPDVDLDSQKAIERCIKEARNQGVPVWIPPGRYVISSEAPADWNSPGYPCTAPACGTPRFTASRPFTHPRPRTGARM
jgi:hypothetical protein